MPSVDRPDSERDFWLFGSPISHSLSPLAHNTVFEALELPNHRFRLHETASFHNASVLERIRSPTFGGAAVTMPHKLEALRYMDSLGDEVKEIGSMNTIVVAGEVEENGRRRPRLEGRNTDTEGIRRALLSTLAEETRSQARPFGEGKSAFIIGGGGATRAAIHALSQMDLSPIWLINRDPTETATIIASPGFAKYDLRPLGRLDQWTEEEAARIACGVGAVPSIPPQTEGEKLVYQLAERVFSSTGQLAGGPRPFMEMAYKPHVTLMYEIARSHGWRPIGGIEALIHQAQAQDGYWLLDSPVTGLAGLTAEKLADAGRIAAQAVRERAGAHV
ncbi:hypothetical protein JCM10908_002184 [Rhodotorula pacifica]|uniref:uncharacterized protein n=1 Tax=Rhodotorula pacifica TaxID=1495444 RepID=UPI0031729F2D